jgi:hypothetical protein
MTDIVERLHNIDHKRFPYFDKLLTEAADLIETLRARVAELSSTLDRHEPLYQSEANDLMARIEAATARRNELMPDEEAAIRMMMDAHTRLKDFGWRDAVYCPKDGSVFKVLEPDSTGKQDKQEPAQHTASRAAMKSQAPADFDDGGEIPF